MDLVKRRDTDAVAVEVPDSALGGGERGRKRGRGTASEGTGCRGGGWLSNILWRD